MSKVIVVDTSAVIAILKWEPEADQLAEIIGRNEPRMSAGTLAELMIVGSGKGLAAPLQEFMASAGIAIVPVDEDMARRVGDAYFTWGKGVYPAGLNFGDCFAYALAKSLVAPVLYVGNDFSKTDCKAALRGR